MPVIEPVPWDALDAELRDRISAARATNMLSTSVPHQVFAHRPEAAKSHLRLYASLFDDTLLDARLLELVRLRIAVFNDCVACKAARKSEDVSDEDLACLSSSSARFSAREQAALRFAELFASDHLAIDDKVMGALRAQFTDAEIVELGLFAATMLGTGRLVRVLGAF